MSRQVTSRAANEVLGRAVFRIEARTVKTELFSDNKNLVARASSDVIRNKL
jgi:hypothetical protein